MAEAVGKSPVACRQLHSRARGKLGDDLPSPRRQGRRALLDRLMAAAAAADVPALTALLADDAVMTSDGGGVVTAARRPVVGADKVTRFLIGIGTRIPDGTTIEVEEINGTECVVVRTHGRPAQVLAFEAEQERLRSMQIVANPEKLSRI